MIDNAEKIGTVELMVELSRRGYVVIERRDYDEMVRNEKKGN